MTVPAALESLRQTILGMQTVEKSAAALLANLTQKLTDALNGDNTEAEIRQMRDDLEQSKSELSTAIVQNTDADRGPNAPDSSNPPIANQDPLTAGAGGTTGLGSQDTTANAPGGGAGSPAPATGDSLPAGTASVTGNQSASSALGSPPADAAEAVPPVAASDAALASQADVGDPNAAAATGSSSAAGNNAEASLQPPTGSEGTATGA